MTYDDETDSCSCAELPVSWNRGVIVQPLIWTAMRQPWAQPSAIEVRMTPERGWTRTRAWLWHTGAWRS